MSRCSVNTCVNRHGEPDRDVSLGRLALGYRLRLVGYLPFGCERERERERERELPDFPFWEIRVCLWVDRSLASSLDVLLRGVAVVIEPVFIGVNHFGYP